MVFWLFLNYQKYLSYCSINWHFFPRSSFLANVPPTKINQNTTKSLKNLGIILLTQAKYCSLAVMNKQKTYVNWDSAAILHLFWIILELFCSHSAAILQLFCNSFAAILQLFWSYFATFLQLFAGALIWVCHGFFCFQRFLQGLSRNKPGFHKDFTGKFVGLENQEKQSQTVWQATLVFISRIVFSRSPGATSHDWCRKEIDPIKITWKSAVFLTKRVRYFQGPIFNVCRSAGDWLGHCMLCENVMMQGIRK